MLTKLIWYVAAAACGFFMASNYGAAAGIWAMLTLSALADIRHGIDRIAAKQ